VIYEITILVVYNLEPVVNPLQLIFYRS